MSVMEGSGQGDVNITGDEHVEDVPGNEMVNKDLDELNRMMKENPGTEPPLIIYNRSTQTRKSNHFYNKPPFDDLYPYRTSTKWPPVSNSSNTTWPLMDLMEHSDDWLIDYEKNLNQTVEDLKNSHFPEQRRTHYNTDFKPHIDMHEPATCRQNFFGGSGIFFLMAILTIAARRWYNRTRPDTVLVTGAGPGAVDQHLKRDMRPPGQGEAVPPYIEVPPPYSYCSGHPPPYPKDTKDPKDNKNGLVETGFTNETTTHSDTRHVEKEFLSENGRKVEEQGTKSAGSRDSVVYVDEKSTSV